MPSISSLISKLRKDYPEYTFVEASEFRWSPESETIFYDPRSNDMPSLLHEVSHATLRHTAYSRDIELIEMERQAWHFATDTLAHKYDVPITYEQVEDSLDTYRDWLHARSTCPTCQATGLQVKKNEYKCLSCLGRWRVNDARVCELRRYKLPENKISAP